MLFKRVFSNAQYIAHFPSDITLFSINRNRQAEALCDKESCQTLIHAKRLEIPVEPFNDFAVEFDIKPGIVDAI